MSSRLKLAGICFAAAFALAACGGGGGSTAVNPDPPPMPTPPPAPTAESIKADASDAITAAIAAGMAASQAKMDAAKYAGMLTAEKVNGESSMAISNAQMVLDAEMAANQAVMDADSALQDAMAAKTAAEALAEDDAERASAIAAAEQAIKQATAEKAAAMVIVDEAVDRAGSLKASAAMVKGLNRLAKGYPMMPAAIGKRIAGEVMSAIDGATPATSETIAATTPMNGIKNDAADIGAMSWAMIVGDDNIMMQRIGDNNAALPVASIAGMDASAVNPGADALSATGGQGEDGKYNDTFSTEATDINYKGILGTVWCLGGKDGCSVNAAGKLVGGWYFTPTPTSAAQLYVPDSDMAGMYIPATMYATYGYWLTYGENGMATGIALHSASTANQADLDLGQAGDPAADVTATYSGSAIGISARGDASGEFTADVSLTAKFAATPTLRGRISNFQGNAVGNWSVVLNETNLGTGSFTNGTTAGSGTPGEWTANAYGPTPVDHDGDGNTAAQPQRPTGFHGRFDANFGDGAAAGAYATRKAE